MPGFPKDSEQLQRKWTVHLCQAVNLVLIFMMYCNTDNTDCSAFTFHTGGSGSSGASDLPWETGTLDGLRALLDLILITAAMDGHNLTRPLLHLVRDWETRRGRERGRLFVRKSGTYESFNSNKCILEIINCFSVDLTMNYLLLYKLLNLFHTHILWFTGKHSLVILCFYSQPSALINFVTEAALLLSLCAAGKKKMRAEK